MTSQRRGRKKPELSLEQASLVSRYKLQTDSGCIKATLRGDLERLEIKTPKDRDSKNASDHSLFMEEVRIQTNFWSVTNCLDGWSEAWNEKD